MGRWKNSLDFSDSQWTLVNNEWCCLSFTTGTQWDPVSCSTHHSDPGGE